LATESILNNNVESSTDNVTVDLFYNNNGNPSASAYLDYISIEAERALSAATQQFQFKNNNAALLSGVGSYNIDNATAIDEVWDITDPYNPSFY